MPEPVIVSETITVRIRFCTFFIFSTSTGFLCKARNTYRFFCRMISPISVFIF